MKNIDLAGMATSNLKRRKSRTLLTIMGIVIGTISIVLMVALGLGMKETFSQQLDQVGSINIIEVSKSEDSTASTRLAEQTDNKLKDIDIEYFKGLEGVEAVSPVLQTNIKLVSGKYEMSASLIGLEPDKMNAFSFDIDTGRLLTDDDENVLLLGGKLPSSFTEAVESNTRGSAPKNNARGFGFGGMKPTEEEETLNVDVFNDRISMTLDTKYSPQKGTTQTQYNIYRVNAIGVLADGDMTRDRNAYMNIHALEQLLEDYSEADGTTLEDGYDKAYVKVYDLDYCDPIESLLEQQGYETTSYASFVETLQSTTDMLQVALGAIGAIALLVAGIGITNTMIMAIHERKREIGVMKVIGATLMDIRNLFLLEAAIIGFFGGAIGILLSVLASQLLSSSGFSQMAMGGGGGKGMSPLSAFSFSIPSWLIIIGLIFTTLIGIISGYIPARKAMKSSALEAIKTE